MIVLEVERYLLCSFDTFQIDQNYPSGFLILEADGRLLNIY